MVWNLSEESYDASVFEDSVIEHKFPGFPAPPLGLLYQLCKQIENWLHAAPENVAVVHCMTGRGRTALTIACSLSWMRGGPQDEAVAAGSQSSAHRGVVVPADSPLLALQAVCERRGSTLDRLTLPSQRRYAAYFGCVLEGQQPVQGTRRLERVLLHGLPDLTLSKEQARLGTRERDLKDAAVAGSSAAAPLRLVLELFRAGSSTPVWRSWPVAKKQDGEARASAGAVSSGEQSALPAIVSRSDGVWKLEPKVPLRGDLLLRVRQLAVRGCEGGGGDGGEGREAGSASRERREVVTRETLCRASFNVGMVGGVRVPGGAGGAGAGDGADDGGVAAQSCVLRLSKRQLDVACGDPRCGDDMYLELIFGPVQQEVEGR